MGELFAIQNDLLAACQLVCFIALVVAGGRIAYKLLRGEDVDAYLLHWAVGIGVVLGFSWLLGNFKP